MTRHVAHMDKPRRKGKFAEATPHFHQSLSPVRNLPKPVPHMDMSEFDAAHPALVGLKTKIPKETLLSMRPKSPIVYPDSPKYSTKHYSRTSSPVPGEEVSPEIFMDDDISDGEIDPEVAQPMNYLKSNGRQAKSNIIGKQGQRATFDVKKPAAGKSKETTQRKATGQVIYRLNGTTENIRQKRPNKIKNPQNFTPDVSEWFLRQIDNKRIGREARRKQLERQARNSSRERRRVIYAYTNSSK